ncbi:MAG: hypothetical protein B7X90_13260 [Novosphingobium sp. 17-62-19]|uniref:COG3650 family protein n=1 Tax=Novosphingobium sp. 17-62-19 TaxID=1970406 RepID=UPI000BD5AE81|nr:hypothetical protein [Novosphingobium sp. 17-62-19]OZA17950.1 MAG: hypothetical protein B7X90_13260 [Novosphingobium sp. 17-62-19]HQS98224.1 hypothetical protein [Novosphingobium sp.]
MRSITLSSSALALFAILLVSACSEPAEPEPETSPSTSAPFVTPTAVEPPASMAAEVSSSDIPIRFRAIGTEPFWSVQVQDGKLTYSTPEMPDGLTVPATLRRSGQIVTYSATIEGKPLELEVSRQTCSDGMSDTVYPLAVIRRIGPDIQRGCAR